jgi:type IV secretory pathway VirB10-like protein
MNTELFLGIIVIILVAAAGVYFYLGRKPSSVAEPTKVEPRVLARPAAAASGEAAKEDAPAPAENKPEAEGAADTPAPAQTPESVPSPQPVADTENFFSEYRPEEGDDVQYEEPDIDQMTEIVVKIKSPEPFTARDQTPQSGFRHSPQNSGQESDHASLGTHQARRYVYRYGRDASARHAHKDCGRAHGRQLRGRRESGGGFA